MSTKIDDYIIEKTRDCLIDRWRDMKEKDDPFTDRVEKVLANVTGRVVLDDTGCVVTTRASAVLEAFSSLIGTETREHVAPIIFRNQVDRKVDVEVDEIFPRSAVCIDSMRLERVDGKAIDWNDIKRFCFTCNGKVVGTRYSEMDIEQIRQCNQPNVFNLGSVFCCSPDEPFMVFGNTDAWKLHLFMDGPAANAATYRLVVGYKSLAVEDKNDATFDTGLTRDDTIKVMAQVIKNHLVQRLFGPEEMTFVVKEDQLRICLNFENAGNVLTAQSSCPVKAFLFTIAKDGQKETFRVNNTNDFKCIYGQKFVYEFSLIITEGGSAIVKRCAPPIDDFQRRTTFGEGKYLNFDEYTVEMALLFEQGGEKTVQVKTYSTSAFLYE